MLSHPFCLFTELLGVTFKGLIDVLVYCLISEKKIKINVTQVKVWEIFFHNLSSSGQHFLHISQDECKCNLQLYKIKDAFEKILIF